MAETTFVPGSGSPEYQLIVKTDTGSTVTATKGETVKQSRERNGIWGFKGLEAGEWTITCTKGSETETRIVTVVTGEDCQIVEITYGLYPSDFTVYLEGTTTPATLGTDYEVVNDNDVAIDQSLWRITKNWKYRCLVNIDVVPLKNGYIDVFCVGGGGGSSNVKRGGSGGGYTATSMMVELVKGAVYTITIGSGGAIGSDGSATIAFGLKANGGKTTERDDGGDGGCGGGSGHSGFSGGTDGGDGADAPGYFKGGKGQGTTTREFGETSGRLYSNGGWGYSGSMDKDPPLPNTGDGAHGYYDTYDKLRHPGGSGIVVFRNARTSAETTELEVAA